MSIRSHPRNEVLLAYATGALDEAPSVLTATHLALCSQCRATAGRMEAVGGALLDTLPTTGMDEHNLTRMMARLDEMPLDPPRIETPHDMAGGPPSGIAAMLPQPLRRYVGADQSAQLPWRRLMNLEYINLKTKGPGQARLLRVAGGEAIPYHGHSGDELVLVLAGGYSDGTGIYHRGDVASADASLAHKPAAERGETCICMTVNYGLLLPTRILAPLGRLFRDRLH